MGETNQHLYNFEKIFTSSKDKKRVKEKERYDIIDDLGYQYLWKYYNYS